MVKSFRQDFVLGIFVLYFLMVSSAKSVSAIQNSAWSSAKLHVISTTKTDDVRPKILKRYLVMHSSPLSENAKDFVDYADMFGLDWKLVVAISGVESTFGKFIPYKSYNAWGWGVYGDNVMRFSSWREGIEAVSRGLWENYINKMNSDNIYNIGRWYAASPRWAGNVNYFMDKIAQFESQYATDNLPISL